MIKIINSCSPVSKRNKTLCICVGDRLYCLFATWPLENRTLHEYLQEVMCDFFLNSFFLSCSLNDQTALRAVFFIFIFFAQICCLASMQKQTHKKKTFPHFSSCRLFLIVLKLPRYTQSFPFSLQKLFIIAAARLFIIVSPPPIVEMYSEWKWRDPSCAYLLIFPSSL